MIQSTSINAFEEVNKTLGERQKVVYDALKHLKQANNKMIADKLNYPINSITPRVHELRNKKLVGVAFQGPDLNTGRKTIYWKIVWIVKN